MASTRSSVLKTLGNENYVECDSLPNGVLPLQKTIIECMLFLMRSDRAGLAQQNVKTASYTLAYVLVDHWNLCDIFTITVIADSVSVQYNTQKFKVFYKLGCYWE